MCMQRQYFDREENEDMNRERFVDDTRVDFRRESQEKNQGTRERDTARTVNGALGQVPCDMDLRCQENMCMRPTTQCEDYS